MLNRLPLISASIAALTVGAHAQIVFGQTDTFSANVQNWQGRSPAWISTGGPGGAGDAFMQLTSDGSTNPNLATFNTNQWSGNYTGAGVGSVSVDFDNLGNTALVMRLVLFEQSTARWVSNASVSLAPGSGWTHAVFALDGNFTGFAGQTTFANAMANANRLMFRHDTVPTSGGTSIAGSVGIDNVHAGAPVPEPATLCVLGFGLLGLRRARRC